MTRPGTVHPGIRHQHHRCHHACLSVRRKPLRDVHPYSTRKRGDPSVLSYHWAGLVSRGRGLSAAVVAAVQRSEQGRS